LGSSKTRAIVAELLDAGDDPSHLRFLGYGEAESQGWHKGLIANLDQVSHSTKEAVEQAERASGVPLESAVVGVGGPQIQGASVASGITLSPYPRELTREDVRRVVENAGEIPLAKDREILHMIPGEFVLDSQKGIMDPIGMQGCYLGVKSHIVSGSVRAMQNVVTAVNRAGVLVETTVLEAFAAAEVVLSEEERELGVLVAVLGGGTCDVVVYKNRGLRMTAVIPIGGDHFTSDVALGLHTAIRDAEAVKKSFGSVQRNLGKESTTIEIPGMGERASWFVPNSALTDILASRAEEMFGLILDEVLGCGLDRQIGAGVVLCGGGAKLRGICDVSEQILEGPTRLGLPPKITDMPAMLESPEYTTLIGLLLYAQKLWRLRSNPVNKSLGSIWKSLLART